MPTATYIALANYTVTGSAVNSVTFSSIPATYRDLVLVFSGALSADSPVYLTYNADTNGYTRISMSGDGSAASSNSGSDGRVVELGDTQSNFIAHIMDYSATDKHKTVLTRSNDASRITYAGASRWASTNAITSILIDPDTTTQIAVGSTLSLYGIVS
jgi:hypothetical protein